MQLIAVCCFKARFSFLQNTLTYVNEGCSFVIVNANRWKLFSVV